MLTDIITPHLKVIFCGINPGLQSSNDGYHFSGRSNRFWKVLHQSGFTPYEIEAVNDTAILDFGYGLTTIQSDLQKNYLSDSIFLQLNTFTK